MISLKTKHILTTSLVALTASLYAGKAEASRMAVMQQALKEQELVEHVKKAIPDIIAVRAELGLDEEASFHEIVQEAKDAIVGVHGAPVVADFDGELGTPAQINGLFTTDPGLDDDTDGETRLHTLQDKIIVDGKDEALAENLSTVDKKIGTAAQLNAMNPILGADEDLTLIAKANEVQNSLVGDDAESFAQNTKTLLDKAGTHGDINGLFHTNPALDENTSVLAREETLQDKLVGGHAQSFAHNVATLNDKAGDVGILNALNGGHLNEDATVIGKFNVLQDKLVGGHAQSFAENLTALATSLAVPANKNILETIEKYQDKLVGAHDRTLQENLIALATPLAVARNKNFAETIARYQQRLFAKLQGWGEDAGLDANSPLEALIAKVEAHI